MKLLPRLLKHALGAFAVVGFPARPKQASSLREEQ